MAKKPKAPRIVESLRHEEATRKNIPTAEYQPVVEKSQQSPKTARYPRNTDLDPQLVWRGKDEQDWSDLVVNAPPLYIQEKVHPKVLIDDLLKQTKEAEQKKDDFQPDLFADFNGIPQGVDKTEFYRHDQNWSNRMILGDSLQVMASLVEREGLRGKVQCIYLDPPYGIKFNSNFQWSTTSRDVKDGKADHITREPEQVKAFRDTWRDGIHSYLTYLRDRLTVARDLLTDSGSIFVQIGDENVHRVRAMMDEVFGEGNFVSQISFKKTGFQASNYLPNNFDLILIYAKNYEKLKFRRPFISKLESSAFVGQDVWFDDREGRRRRLTKQEKENLNLLAPENIFRHKLPESAGSSGRDEPIIYNGHIFSTKSGETFLHHRKRNRTNKASRTIYNIRE
jgi:adenine-specific DNA-methyltransferase